MVIIKIAVLLFLLAFSIGSPDENPSILFKDDFENGLALWKDPTDQAKIVSCKGGRIGNCLQLLKKANADNGGVYTKPIPSPFNVDFTQKVFVEFLHYSGNYTDKPENSSLCVGYTNSKRDGFVWSACGDLSFSNYSLKNSVPMFQIQDQINGWKLVKFEIHPPVELQTTDDIVLVFLDYNGIKSTPGAIQIDNIAVYKGSLCFDGCKSCQDYQTCDACDDGLVSINGALCVRQEGCIDSLLAIKKSEDITVSFEQVKADDKFLLSMTIGKYDLENCFSTVLRTVTATNQLIKEIDYEAKSSSQLSASIDLKTDCSKIDEFHFDCHFEFLIATRGITLLDYTFTQSIEYAASDQPSVVYQLRTFDIGDIPPIIVSVASKAVACSFVQGKQSCTGADQIKTITIGEYFLVTLSIIDQQFKGSELESGKVYVKGLGTFMPIKIQESYTKIGEITYKVMVELVPAPDDLLTVTAKFSTKRRLLTQTEPKIENTPLAELKLKYRKPIPIQVNSSVSNPSPEKSPNPSSSSSNSDINSMGSRLQIFLGAIFFMIFQD